MTNANIHAIQFLNGAGQSSKDRVALSMIEIVCLSTQRPFQDLAYKAPSLYQHLWRRYIDINATIS